TAKNAMTNEVRQLIQTHREELITLLRDRDGGRQEDPPAQRDTVETIKISAPGLVLRPWRLDDAAEVLPALLEPAIALWNPPRPMVVDLKSAKTWLARRTDLSTGDHISLAVADPATGTLLGSVSLHSIRDGNASVGYWTVESARKRGVASRAVAAITEWGFLQRGLHRIELCHAVANPGSCGVAERAGYQLEGTLRESLRYGDGRRHDEHVHARLTSDS
ncbi:GNAT family N-acetyltransferase, partial [Plantactinospora solaniradicis]